MDDGANARPARAAPVRQAAPPPSPFVLPRGYRWWDDPSGYSVAVPTGWTERRDAPGGRVFTAPGGRAGLRISRWEPGTTNLVAALIDRERQAPPAGYRRVRIEALPRGSGAVWEYLFRDRAVSQARALKQVVTVDGGTYLVEWHTPRSAWTANLQKLAVVLDSVRPLRGA
nr:hypothetical protein GCM10020092_065230 [Actinoplanes digitatis]